MLQLAKTVKVSSKGQITLPRKVREALGTEYVRIVLVDSHVHIEPVREPAGMLSHHARRRIDPAKARDIAWSEAMIEKHGHR